jgi:hypothetical protein
MSLSIKAFLSSAILALVATCVFAALTLYGVVSMEAARILLAIAWFIAVAGIVASGLWSNASRRFKIGVPIVAALVLAIGFWRLDAWVVRQKAELKPVRLRIYSLELQPLVVGQPVTARVYFKNLGEVKAPTQGYFWTQGVQESSDVSKMAQQEDQIYQRLKTFVVESNPRATEIPLAAELPFMNHVTSERLAESDLRLMRGHKIRLYFAGVLKYHRAGSIRFTTYCYFTYGDAPRDWLICHRYNDEDITSL